jgi:hypothetical protein
MSHLKGVLQDGNKLLDLAIVQHPGGDPALGSQPLQQIYPFRPFTVFRPLNGSHLGIYGDGKLVFGNEIKSTTREPVIDPGKDEILFLDYQVGRKMRQISLLLGKIS